jgi:nitrogen fixation-related uncharacterized protein
LFWGRDKGGFDSDKERKKHLALIEKKILTYLKKQAKKEAKKS